jgi:hypothetical protein
MNSLMSTLNSRQRHLDPIREPKKVSNEAGGEAECWWNHGTSDAWEFNVPSGSEVTIIPKVSYRFSGSPIQ